MEDLGALFAKLDPFRDILDEVLHGWAPPCVMVLGTETSGKSTIFDRLTLMSIFPVIIRRAAAPKTIQVTNDSTDSNNTALADRELGQSCPAATTAIRIKRHEQMPETQSTSQTPLSDAPEF